MTSLVQVIAAPLQTVKKFRRFDEVLTRGGQAVSAYRFQHRSAHISEGDEFLQKIDATEFEDTPVIPETLWRKFFENSEEMFFPVFNPPEASATAFRELFGEQRATDVIEAAESILDGKLDLLGLTNVYVGEDIDWHLEPLSATRSPLKHWKEFEAPSELKTGNRKILWELNRHQHFFTLGLAYWLTRDERFAECFVHHLMTWMDQNPPGLGVNWSSSLEVSFAAISWLWAFHFFRDAERFTPELFNAALKYLYAHGRHIERYLSTYYSPNTHLTGEGLGLYYLGTQLPFLKSAAQWRKLGEDILTSESTRQILPDGVYFEQSTWYQRYTVDFYNHFFVLRSLFGGQDEAEEGAVEERLADAYDFLAAISLPDGRTPLVGDDDGGRMLPLTGSAPDDFRGSLAVGAELLGRGEHKFAAGTFSEELFWLTGRDGIASFSMLAEIEPETASRSFPDGGYCVIRDGWQGTDNYLLVDCGEVGSLSGGHGHADTLSIAVAAHGRTLLVDSGTYTYHESKPLRDYFRSTVAHNTLVIDGESSSAPGGTFAWKTRADATLDRWLTEERFDLFEGSHNGYQRLEDPATHSRSILFLRNDYWIMRDVAETTGEHEYALNFHFAGDRKPGIGDAERWIGEDDHRIFTFGDNGKWLPEVGWTSTNHGKRTHTPFMQFVSSGVGTQEFFTFIIPDGASEVNELPIDGARAFVIKFTGYTDLFVFADEGATIDNGLFRSNFRYSWARLRDGERVPDEFVLIDGDHFSINNDEILTDTPVEHASARRYGNELYVKLPDRRLKGELSELQ